MNKQETVAAVFIATAGTHNTGGNCRADLFELKSGRVLFIADECVGVIDSMTAWNESIEGARYLDGADSMARADDALQTEDGGVVLTGANLTFVERITTYEPDGPVSVDLLVLCDGRVLGIDSESVFLYPSMEAFDAIGEDSAKDGAYPSLALEGAA